MAGRTLSARSLAYLYAAGATLLLLSMAVPSAEIIHKGGLVAIAVVAYGVAAALLAMSERVPPGAYHLIVALGTVLITLAVYLSRGTAAYATLYVWVGLYGFYFFTRGEAALHVLWVAVAYGTLLIVDPHTGAPFARWLVTVGTVTVAGTFVAHLVDVIRARAAEAAARADGLKAAELRTRSILETANEGFLALDDTGKILDVNRRGEELFGWDGAELLGRTAGSTLVPERLRGRFERELREFARSARGTPGGREIEFVGLHRDGDQFPLEATVSFRCEGDRPVFNAFIRDVSERKRAERHMREQIQDLEVVAGVARDLAGVTDAHAARPAICKAAAQLTGGSVGMLYEPDRAGVELVSTAAFGVPFKPIHLPFAGRPSGAATAFSSGRPLLVPDVRGHPAVNQQVVKDLGVASALWQPILRNRAPIGVLVVAWEEPVAQVTARVASIMALLAAEAAVAIERADLLGRLEAVARTDDLTGLANRRAWEEQLPRELSRAHRDDTPLCVAMLDLDHFKAFNDRHGHPAGDRLLKEATAAWRDMLRPSDLLARYGGEEFVLLLPNCEADAALEVVERLRSLTFEGESCSAGVVEWDRVESADALVSRADRALYEAKAAGRDQTVAA